MERIGEYVVLRKLGEGGMGTVYLARTRGGRAVAVKVVKPELAADPVFRERFRTEVAAARAVGGFHTAPVVEADVDARPPWLATAYIPGPTLAGHVAARGPMDGARLRSLGAALAEALLSIHSCGLVHRDLKPANIIMAEDGLRVLDFGIARAVESTRVTTTGTAFGTPGYLAPEQALGETVTGAADVFALGVILVFASGGSAWGEGASMGVMYRSVHEPPDISAVPAGLQKTVAACLEKEPAARPTPAALLDLLTRTPPNQRPATYSPTLPVPSRLPPQPPAAPVPLPPTQPAHAPRGGPQQADSDLVITDGEAGFAADGTGVTLEIKGVAADFDWSEVASVTPVPARLGHHLTVVVSLHDGTVYSCELKARRTALRREWAEQIRLVVDRRLDAHLSK